MSFHTIHAPIRFAHGLFVVVLGLAAAACGGGEQDASVAQHVASAREASPQSVKVEGCVLDRHYIPTTGTPVRVLAADGRLLGNAQSDGQGRFTLSLPVHSDVLLQVDRLNGESLPMHVNAQSSIWDQCLLDDAA